MDFYQALGNAVRAAECSILANNPFVNGSAARLNPAERAVFNDRINQVRRLKGCDPVGDSQPPDPEFFGGQCDDAFYVGTFQYETGPEGSPTTQTAFFSGRGPILGGRDDGGPSSPVGTGIVGRGVGFRTGTPFGCGGIPPATGQPIRYSAFVNGGRNGRVTSITPCGLDNCGDPEPVYPPPTNINIDTDITYNIDNGPDITVNVPIDYSPIDINLDGTFNIPFNFNFGGFEFSGGFNLSPSGTVNINPPRINPGGGQGLEELEPDPPGQTFEPLPAAEKIIGVVVTASEIDNRKVSAYSSPGIPDIFVPRLGSVKFVYSLGGATFFSSDIDIKDRRTFIECPFSQGADAVIASPQLGVNLSFVPIRGFPLATKNDLFRPT